MHGHSGDGGSPMGVFFLIPRELPPPLFFFLKKKYTAPPRTPPCEAPSDGHRRGVRWPLRGCGATGPRSYCGGAVGVGAGCRCPAISFSLNPPPPHPPVKRHRTPEAITRPPDRTPREAPESHNAEVADASPIVPMAALSAIFMSPPMRPFLAAQKFPEEDGLVLKPFRRKRRLGGVV